MLFNKMIWSFNDALPNKFKKTLSMFINNITDNVVLARTYKEGEI